MHSCEHDFWDHSCLLNFTCLETKSIFHIWGSSIYVLNIKVCSIWGSYNSLILQLVQVTLWYILLCSWSHDCILVSTFSLQGRLKLHTPFRHEPKKKTVPLVLVQWKEFKQAGILELQECTNKGWADGLRILWGLEWLFGVPCRAASCTLLPLNVLRKFHAKPP